MRPERPTRGRVPRLSRLRLRLAAVFTATFVVALAVVALLSFGWLWRESTRRLDARLSALTTSVYRAIQLRHRERPDTPLSAIVADVRQSWVVGTDAWLAFDAAGELLATTADAARTARVLRAHPGSASPASISDLIQEDDDLRMAVRPEPTGDGLPPVVLVAIGSTEGIERDTELLLITLAIAAPLIAAVSLASGYVMARWALRPADTLGAAIDALSPATLEARLPVREPADEIGELARRFNALLSRLDASQSQNREFVREAAHQIRTPLTLVRGEAELALTSARGDAALLGAALHRIERASQQMQRRVDDLLLLAEAEAGARLEQRTPVELDTLALESVDLFRARAAQHRRPLAYGELEPTTVLGDAALLREAVLELLENACRHGREGTDITVAVQRSAGHAELIVESRRAGVEATAAPAAQAGLGQRIVRWIADAHEGEFTIQLREPDRYIAILSIPEANSSESPSRA